MKIVTHNGDYHADDVFAVATLLLLYPGSHVVRSRNPEDFNGADYIVDVGFEYDPVLGHFDHHQLGGAGERPNGIPYASFGLVWKAFGEKVSGSKEVADLIEDQLVIPIDAMDNGVAVSTPLFENVHEYTINDFICSFRDYSDSSEEGLRDVFLQAVKVAEDLLGRKIKAAGLELQDMQEVRKIFEATTDKRIIVLDKERAWKKVLTPIPETLYVVYPRKDGKWGVRAVRKAMTGFEVKKPLPASWAGETGDRLKEVTGVKDAFFVHRDLFIAVSGSKEGALELAQKALNA
ncbi:MYG1 family protein [Candidatus Parcubacteria bacterium]|nr:MYG1 family protein [Candidatus Parcubacteria bacterium]